jgi:hypothetical protein
VDNTGGVGYCVLFWRLESAPFFLSTASHKAHRIASFLGEKCKRNGKEKKGKVTKADPGLAPTTCSIRRIGHVCTRTGALFVRYYTMGRVMNIEVVEGGEGEERRCK